MGIFEYNICKEAVEEMLNELWGRIDGYRN